MHMCEMVSVDIGSKTPSYSKKVLFLAVLSSREILEISMYGTCLSFIPSYLLLCTNPLPTNDAYMHHETFSFMMPCPAISLGGSA